MHEDFRHYGYYTPAADATLIERLSCADSRFNHLVGSAPFAAQDEATQSRLIDQFLVAAQTDLEQSGVVREELAYTLEVGRNIPDAGPNESYSTLEAESLNLTRMSESGKIALGVCATGNQLSEPVGVLISDLASVRTQQAHAEHHRFPGVNILPQVNHPAYSARIRQAESLVAIAPDLAEAQLASLNKLPPLRKLLDNPTQITVSGVILRQWQDGSYFIANRTRHETHHDAILTRSLFAHMARRYHFALQFDVPTEFYDDNGVQIRESITVSPKHLSKLVIHKDKN